MAKPFIDFKVGQLVALCETWPTRRVIMITKVISVGKRDVKTDRDSRYRVGTGATWDKDGPYCWRSIQPLTRELFAEAEANKVSGIHLALGHSLPSEAPSES